MHNSSKPPGKVRLGYRSCTNAMAILPLMATQWFYAHALTLNPISGGLPQVVGVSFHDSADPAQRFLIFSWNRDTDATSTKFGKITATGAIGDFAFYSGTQNLVRELPNGYETKLASIRTITGGSGIAGGFTLGTTFCGNGVAREIMKINPDGSVQKHATLTRPAAWATLPATYTAGGQTQTTGTVLGIAHDRDNVLGGYLIILTAEGGIWNVGAGGGNLSGPPLAWIQGGTLESCVVVPNNPSRYGMIAGQILVGRDDATAGAGLWMVNPSSGTTQELFKSESGALTADPAGSAIAAEDLDLIQPSESLFLADFANGDSGSLLSADASASPAPFPSDANGDILVVQETDQSLVRIQAVGGALNCVSVGANLGFVFEHATFAALTVRPELTLTVADATATEPPFGEEVSDTARFVLHRPEPGPALPVRLQVTGSAKFSVDYQATGVTTVSGTTKTVTLPDGVTDIGITISPFDDSRSELVESVIFTLLADVPPAGVGARYSVGSPFQATATIASNDAIPVPSGWKLYDLGTLGGDQSYANGIGPVVFFNGLPTATVVGSSRWQAGNINTRAFQFPVMIQADASLTGTMAALPATGYTWHTAYAINSWGRIVGQALPNGSTCPRGFFYDTYIQPTLSLDADAVTRDVNETGEQVGYSDTIVVINGVPTIVKRATYWDGTSTVGIPMGDLANNNATKNSYAYAINGNRRIVGKSQILTSATYHGFRTQNAARTIMVQSDDITNLTEATDINDLDEVVGSYALGSNVNVARLVSGHGAPADGYVDLVAYPTPSNTIATAINNLGVVVGHRYSQFLGRYVPELWWNLGSNVYGYDLQAVNTYTGPEAAALNVTAVGGGSWDLRAVTGLNDNHWIVGWGYKNGQARAFLLKPN